MQFNIAFVSATSIYDTKKTIFSPIQLTIPWLNFTFRNYFQHSTVKYSWQIQFKVAFLQVQKSEIIFNTCHYNCSILAEEWPSYQVVSVLAFVLACAEYGFVDMKMIRKVHLTIFILFPNIPDVQVTLGGYQVPARRSSVQIQARLVWGWGFKKVTFPPSGVPLFLAGLLSTSQAPSWNSTTFFFLGLYWGGDPLVLPYILGHFLIFWPLRYPWQRQVRRTEERPHCHARQTHCRRTPDHICSL